MSIDLEADIKFPARADDWVETLVIGTLLTLFSFLFIPILPVYGYLVHTARAAMADVDEPLSFTDWETLFVDGLKGLLIVFVYQLLPMLVGIVSIAALAGVGFGNETLAGVSLLVFGLGSLTAMVLAVIFGYLGLVALLSFASEDDLGAAFDLAALKEVGLDGDYAIQWLYGIALLVVANILLSGAMSLFGLFTIIPILGLIIFLFGMLLLMPVGAAVMFYTQIAVFRIWGRGYAESRGLTPDDVPDWVGRDVAKTGESANDGATGETGHSAALADESLGDGATPPETREIGGNETEARADEAGSNTAPDAEGDRSSAESEADSDTRPN